MRHSDPEGLYRALGVMPNADQEEIKNAYRRLAKETHPDLASESSAQRFQKVYNAYKILSDTRARARYDRRFTHEDHDHSWLGIGPVHCDRCGNVTAQPRKLKFQRMYSLVFASFHRPIEGIYCRACAQTEAVKSSVFTALFGWWGLPFAPLRSAPCSCSRSRPCSRWRSRASPERRHHRPAASAPPAR